MPFVNVKIVKDQISQEMKKQIIERLTDLIPSAWGFDGISMNERSKLEFL